MTREVLLGSASRLQGFDRASDRAAVLGTRHFGTMSGLKWMIASVPSSRRFARLSE
jgi:hypothetical protein